MAVTYQVGVTVTTRDADGLQIGQWGGITSSHEDADNVLHTTYAVPNATTDMQLDIGPLASVVRMALTSDYDMTLQVASSSTGDARLLPAGETMLFAFDPGVTALYVTNASGHAATLKAVMVG